MSESEDTPNQSQNDLVRPSSFVNPLAKTSFNFGGFSQNGKLPLKLKQIKQKFLKKLPSRSKFSVDLSNHNF